MKAVIYARYSSDSQREESIEGQIRECTAFAEKNDITILRHYIDRAYSAKTDNRPDFQEMIKDSGKKLFDVVLVWKFDRFARNRFDSANYKMILKKNGVHLISVMEPIAEGSQGILVETLLEGMAEYYSAELSEKVIRGQTESALKGRCTGGTGTIGLIASGQAKHVIGVELSADAVRDAKMNARTNQVTNIEFYRNDAGEFLVDLAEQNKSIDVLMMDPPRSGSTEEFLDCVAKIAPKKVVYISCNPETLARDLKYITKKGYEVKRAVACDMFPFTEHVETVVLMSREKA